MAPQNGLVSSEKKQKQKQKKEIKEKDGNVNSFEEFYGGMQKFISQDVIAS